jgi:hypothetical protein
LTLRSDTPAAAVSAASAIIAAAGGAGCAASRLPIAGSVGFASATGFIPQNLNFAIKTSVVRSFLDANHVGYTASAGVTQMATADVADLARKFTVQIECRQ